MGNLYVLGTLLICLLTGTPRISCADHPVWGDLPDTIMEIRRTLASMPASAVMQETYPHSADDKISIWKALPLVMGEMIKISAEASNRTLQALKSGDRKTSRHIPITRIEKKCFTSAHEDRWCFGKCKFSVFKSSAQNSSELWKPHQPLVGALDCDREFFCKTWDFGRPLRVAVYLQKKSTLQISDIDETVRKIVETRRNDLLEWNEYGAVGNKSMVIIGDENHLFSGLAWMKGEHKVVIKQFNDGDGAIFQRWIFGSSIEVNIGWRGEGYVEEWFMGKTQMMIMKTEFQKDVNWENKDVELLKKARRYISEWCEENRDWVMLPCKIYQFSDSQVDKL